jgi:hypothetical protein
MGGLQARVSAGRAKPVLLPVHCQRRELDFGLTDEAE